MTAASLLRIDHAVASGGFDFQGVMGMGGVGLVASNMVGGVPRRVVFDPVFACRECDRCRSGLSRHCIHRWILGVVGRDGALAQHICLPESNLVDIPSSLSDDEAIFAVPVAMAIHASRQIMFEGQTFVTVLGDSLEGLLCAQLMHQQNASVRVVGEQLDRLAILDRWGITGRPLAETGRRQDQDIVIDAIGSAASLNVAMELVRPRGTVVRSVVGVERHSAAVDLTTQILDEVSIIGSFCGSVAEAVGELAGGLIDTVGLIGSRTDLDGARAILTGEGQSSPLLTVVKP